MKGKRTDVWFRMQNLPKKTRSKLLLVAISLGIGCLLAFALAEFSCRLLGFGGGIVYESELYRTAAAPLAYELVPGYAGNSYRSKVTVSADGFRRTGAEGERPIACVGDSCTFGMGVDDTDAWPAQLAGIADTATINAGICGYNLTQCRAVIEDKLLPLGPAAVIIGINPNDLEPAYAFDGQYIVFPKARKSLPIPGKRLLRAHSHFYQFAALRYRALVNRFSNAPVIADPDAVLADGMRPDLSAIKAACDAAGVPLICVLICFKNAHLSALCEELGIAISNGMYEAEDMLPDSHPNPEGHRKIATAAAELLSRSKSN